MKDRILLTAGAEREIKRQGFTTACGGAFSNEFVIKLIASDAGAYFKGDTEGGRYMSNIESTKKQLDEGAEALQKSALKVVETAKNANKQLVEVNRNFRDGADKMNGSIEKMLKIVERKDFNELVKLTVTFTEAMERLAKLEEAGILDKVAKAMSQGEKQ